jgi:hypothetical protein
MDANLEHLTATESYILIVALIVRKIWFVFV